MHNLGDREASGKILWAASSGQGNTSKGGKQRAAKLSLRTQAGPQLS